MSFSICLLFSFIQDNIRKTLEELSDLTFSDDNYRAAPKEAEKEEIASALIDPHPLLFFLLLFSFSFLTLHLLSLLLLRLLSFTSSSFTPFSLFSSLFPHFFRLILIYSLSSFRSGASATDGIR